MKSWINTRKHRILLCFVAVFVWGLIAHGYGFMRNSLSHDVLNAFVATKTEEIWKIQLGRYFVPVYRAIFRGAVSLPWLIGLLGLFWTSCAVFLVNELLETQNRFLTILIAGIMTTNITWIAQIATYIYEFDFNALALLLSVGAVCCWRWWPNVHGFVVGSICLFVSAGIYQAYLTVFISLVIWLSIIDLFCTRDVKHVFRRGITAIFMLFVGVFTYWLTGKLIYHVTKISAQSRTDIIAAAGATHLISIERFKGTLRELVFDILHPAYGNSLLYIGCAIMAACLALLALHQFYHKKYTVRRILFIGLMVAVLPFGMNSLYFLLNGDEFHDLMNYAAWLFYVFAGHFAFMMSRGNMVPGKFSHVAKIVTCFVLLLFLSLNLTLANKAYVKKELEADATLSAMTRVTERIEQTENYVPGETPVAFFSTNTAKKPIEGFEDVNHIMGLWMTSSLNSDSSRYFYNLYAAYYRYILQTPILLCSDDLHAQLRTDPRVESMPMFPSDGCIEWIDGILVVKLDFS